MSNDSGCVVTLAAYNEERNIAPVVQRVQAMGFTCIVVDDGSSDATVSVAREAGAKVISHARNLGQGDAVLTGFKAALALEGCGVIIEMDADGQHDPAEIQTFIDKLSSSDVDIVVGSRILGSPQERADFLRTTFLPHYTHLINRITGYSMTDALCGFRGFRRSSLARVEHLLDQTLEPQYLAAEMFVRFSAAGLKVAEVPVHLKPRTTGVSSKGVLRYGFGILKAIARALFDIKTKKM